MTPNISAAAFNEAMRAIGCPVRSGLMGRVEDTAARFHFWADGRKTELVHKAMADLEDMEAERDTLAQMVERLRLECESKSEACKSHYADAERYLVIAQKAERRVSSMEFTLKALQGQYDRLLATTVEDMNRRMLGQPIIMTASAEQNMLMQQEVFCLKSEKRKLEAEVAALKARLALPV